MSSAYIIWQDPTTRMWEPVAKLTISLDQYKLAYTEGSLNPGFSAFPRMNIKGKHYLSNDLFPFFQNRLIPERRPEFYSMLSWLDMNVNEYDPLEVLSVSGGAKKTDNFRIVKVPERTKDNKYRIKFFVSGIAYLSNEIKDEILSYDQESQLHYVFEESNNFDQNAVAILENSSKHRVGYYPKYLNEDLKLLDSLTSGLNNEEGRPKINIIKVNKSAPEQYRLLCELISAWPEEFTPFCASKYKLLNEESHLT